MNIEQRIKELEGKAAMELDHTDIYLFGERDVAKQALKVINHLQSELERYKSLWEANAAESKEIIAELEAKDEWQDISSAPRDGTFFLGWEMGCGIEKTRWYSWHDKAGGFRNSYHGWNPTHWKPLPKPPKQNH